MKWSFEIGRPFGIPLRVHLTFFLLLLLAALAGAGMTQSWRGAVTYVLFISAIFACVVLHELVHSLQARRYGVRVASIMLTPIGGVAQMERIPEDPNQELAISILGPVTNVVIGLAIAIPVYLIGGPDKVLLFKPTENFWGSLVVANLGLAVFNLLPAFPMDGGRMLRAVLAQHLEYVRATDIAAWVGKICGAGMVISFPWHHSPFLILIGVVVYLGATQEARMVRARAIMRQIPVAHTMVTSFSVVSPWDDVGTVLTYSTGGYQRDFPVVSDGRLVGVVGHDQMAKAIRERGTNLYVGDVMQRHAPTGLPTENLFQLQEKMQAAGVTVVPIVDTGRVIGLVSLDSIRRFLAGQPV